MAKPKKPEIISLSEMAKRAGVSRPAVIQWLASQEAKGIPLIHLQGRRGKMVDAANPLIAAYIANTLGKGIRPKEGTGGAKSPEALRKLRNSIRKTELQTAALRGKYISRDFAHLAVDKFFELNVKHLAALPDNVCRALTKELGVTDKEALEKIKGLFVEDVKRCLSIAEKQIADFKKATPVKYDDDKTSAVQKG
jgi:hypothetical protein